MPEFKERASYFDTLSRIKRWTDPRLEARYRRRIERLAAAPPSPFMRRLELLGYATTAAATLYMIFFHKFRHEPNVFTPIRDWSRRRYEQFWSLSEEEEAELRERGQIK